MSRVHGHNSAVSRGAALNIVLRLKHPSLQPSTHFFVALTFHSMFFGHAQPHASRQHRYCNGIIQSHSSSWKFHSGESSEHDCEDLLGMEEMTN